MGRKRQRFDIHPGARFTCDRATGRGAGPLLVGHVDLGRANSSPDRADPSTGLGRAGLGRADLSRAEPSAGFGRAGSRAALRSRSILQKSRRSSAASIRVQLAFATVPH